LQTIGADTEIAINSGLAPVCGAQRGGRWEVAESARKKEFVVT